MVQIVDEVVAFLLALAVSGLVALYFSQSSKFR